MSETVSVLGENLATLRKMQRLTQANLAELAGVSRNCISLIEREKGNPKMVTLIKIFYALGYTATLKITIREDVLAAIDALESRG